MPRFKETSFVLVVPLDFSIEVIDAVEQAIGSYFNDGKDLAWCILREDDAFNHFVRVKAPGMTREIANIGLDAAMNAGALRGEVV